MAVEGDAEGVGALMVRMQQLSGHLRAAEGRMPSAAFPPLCGYMDHWEYCHSTQNCFGICCVRNTCSASSWALYSSRPLRY